MTVYIHRIFGNFPVKNTVCTPYIYGFGQPCTFPLAPAATQIHGPDRCAAGAGPCTATPSCFLTSTQNASHTPNSKNVHTHTHTHTMQTPQPHTRTTHVGQRDMQWGQALSLPSKDVTTDAQSTRTYTRTYTRTHTQKQCKHQSRTPEPHTHVGQLDLQRWQAFLPPPPQRIHCRESDGHPGGVMCQGEATRIKQHLRQGDDALAAPYQTPLCVHLYGVPGGPSVCDFACVIDLLSSIHFNHITAQAPKGHRTRDP
jgi:hypothetical protein